MEKEWTRTELAGAVATAAWIAASLGLYIVSDTATLYSFDAAAFIIVGMFIAAFIFGTLFGAIDRAGTRILSRLGIRRPFAIIAGFLLVAIESGLVIVVAVTAFTTLYGL